MSMLMLARLILALLWSGIGCVLSAIAWAFLWIMVILVVELVIIDTVSLGPRFNMMTVVFAPLAALAIVVVVWASPRRQKRRLGTSWEKRHPRKALLVFGSFVFLMLGVAGGPPLADRLSRPADAADARESFVVNYVGDVEDARLERTLAEFERARRTISEYWSLPYPSPQISLELFRDLREYREAGAADWSGGYAQCHRESVTIVVPLEEASNVFEEEPPSGTPLHEMVHAAWCQKLGRASMHSIQRWFHEGMAQWYEDKGIHRFQYRAWNRWAIWFNREHLLPTTEFCNYEPGANWHEIALFYGTSHELIRSLEAKHGIKHLNAIVDDVEAGIGFDDSLRDRLGGTCSELYSEWSQSF